MDLYYKLVGFSFLIFMLFTIQMEAQLKIPNC